MSPTIGVLIMMNNYFHDVATAMLAASGAALWVMVKKYEGQEDEAVTRYFLSIYTRMTKVARFSLYWILIGGVPRTLAYRSFEWANAVEHVQIPALIVKHIIVFSLVGAGVYLWLKVNRRVKAIREKMGA